VTGPASGSPHVPRSFLIRECSPASPLNRENIQTIDKSPKFVVSNHPFEIAVGRRHHSHIHFSRVNAAKPFKLPFPAISAMNRKQAPLTSTRIKSARKSSARLLRPRGGSVERTELPHASASSGQPSYEETGYRSPSVPLNRTRLQRLQSYWLRMRAATSTELNS
jgi:hypothetical protein